MEFDPNVLFHVNQQISHCRIPKFDETEKLQLLQQYIENQWNRIFSSSSVIFRYYRYRYSIVHFLYLLRPEVEARNASFGHGQKTHEYTVKDASLGNIARPIITDIALRSAFTDLPDATTWS
ncbi:hypothetical protein K0M31_008961 [Melipona bicolor]|uniref:Uncharacterized protein n=1 Tax=Melipona bicolor TaxID=60889 RepID=A0AA40FQX0_9HYME|nr:hypothetical protein K0M31_008959 [Melipona bicolor]KAK1123343.1 hypothetical protein K0M31_008961 [Melipona bicolor]